MTPSNHAEPSRLQRSLSDIDFVFVDIGASGELPPRFDSLQKYADLIRFDPDARDIRTVENKFGRRVVTINKAVTHDDSENIAFHLTKSPYCSSTLWPDFEKLGDFEYAALFEVLSTESVPATTLEKAIADAKLPGAHWINLDTQGTELPIVQSLAPATINAVAAIDIEASLYAHYLGANTLSEIHAFMIASGFWLAETRSHLRTRMTNEAGGELRKTYRGKWLKGHFDSTLHKAPTTIECLYLRTVRSAAALDLPHDGYCRLALACLTADAPEYAYQVNAESARRFGMTPALEELQKLTDQSFRLRLARSRASYVRSWVWGKIRSSLRLAKR